MPELLMAFALGALAMLAALTVLAVRGATELRRQTEADEDWAGEGRGAQR